MLTELKTKSRAWVLLQSALKTDATRSDYGYRLDQYLEWTKLENFDLLVNREPKEIHTELENYLLELKLTKSPSAIRVIFYAIFLFYSMNSVILNTTLLKKMFPTDEEIRENKAYTTEQVRTILETIPKRKTAALKYKATRMRALIHFFAASGARAGHISWLKMKDLQKIEDCYSVKIYGGTQSQYITFLTPEATSALDEYLAMRENLTCKLEPNDPVFDLDLEAMRVAITRLIRKAIPAEMTTTNRYDISVLHGFRKRFNTILKSNSNINVNAIERMMGHSSRTIGLDTAYYKPTVELLYAEYKKGIADLSIYKHSEKNSHTE